MKLSSRSRRSQSGSVLVLTIILGAILLITLGSYYYLVRTENLMVAQSQAWNSALALAEAGIEEGMAQINVNFGTSNYLGSVGTNFGGLNGGVYGPKSNTKLGYALSISNDFPPSVYCTGTSTVAVVGQPITRTVLVKTSQAYAFGSGITALLNVDMKGNYVTVDSFDSADPQHSTNGLYWGPWHKANGNVSSTQGNIDAGNAQIYGKVITSPGATASAGANGSVGDLAWVGGGTLGIEPGWWENDYNATFPDVSPPYPTGFAVPFDNGTNTYYLNGSGSYYVNGDFNIKANQTLYVNGVVNLYVTGNFIMQSQTGSFIQIAPGATLNLYVGTVSGPAVSAVFTTVNNGGNCNNFHYYGLPSNTAVSWSGNAAWIGTVYAPEANFTLGGGGNNNMDFQGGCVVNSVTMNGHFNFHYDENLARNGPTTGFIAFAWQEL